MSKSVLSSVCGAATLNDSAVMSGWHPSACTWSDSSSLWESCQCGVTTLQQSRKVKLLLPGVTGHMLFICYRTACRLSEWSQKSRRPESRWCNTSTVQHRSSYKSCALQQCPACTGRICMPVSPNEYLIRCTGSRETLFMAVHLANAMLPDAPCITLQQAAENESCELVCRC